ncbi:MAG: 16S rRNA (uracil(1498)-N(3))-methyltransferase, partial [Chloroflexi bacterium]|nr:16S rRNA (uracil(1498)-N(3))-methyltransferase [Chloroflexota bacterium]
MASPSPTTGTLMHRFLYAPLRPPGEMFDVTGAITHQIRQVLRLRPGESITLFDGAGNEAQCVIARVSARAITVCVHSWQTSTVDEGLQLHLFPALIRATHFEILLQKATELGVARITPLWTQRTVIQPKVKGEAEVSARWLSIVREAAEQSGRALLPQLDPPLALPAALALASSAERILFCRPEPSGRIDDAVGHPKQRVALFIGPEGGWTAEELA